ncbi:MAG: GNAT family N-acetyltransferase [Dehalococcoidales bacterium]
MLQIKLLKPEREDEYTRLILSDERSLFNSSLKFRELLRRVTGASDYYLIALEGGKIVGALPAFLKLNAKYGNVLNSLPWYGSNPGIVVDSSNPDRQQVKINLLNAFHELAQEKQAVTSTIITRPFEVDQELYQKYTKYNYLDSRIGMMTPLPEFGENIDADLMSIIHSKTRNLVRKAQKSGMKFYHDNSQEALRFLADTHYKNMVEVGAPPKESELFETLAAILNYDKDYRIYIAELDGVKTAALLLTYFNKTVGYFTPAIVEEYRSYQPLNLLIFNAMKDAAEKGFRYWNWGGTTLPSQEGVYHFKKRWGSQECTYYYYVRSYGNIDHLLAASKETLLSEYPYFYVLPFSQLKNQGKVV